MKRISNIFLFFILIFLIAISGTFCNQVKGKDRFENDTVYRAKRMPEHKKGSAKTGHSESSTKEPTPERLVNIKTEEAVLAPRYTLPPISGRTTFNATRMTYIYSPIGGRTVEIKAKLGDKVCKEAHMVTIESVELGQAQAAFVNSRAALTLAQQAYDRVKNLYEHGAIAKKSYQEAYNDLIKKKAKFEVARATLFTLGMDDSEVAELMKEDAKLTGRVSIESPISGTVVEQKTLLGMYIKPNDLLYTVADLSTLWVLGNVFEKDLSFLKLGKNVAVETLSYPGEFFPGKISYISDVIDPTTRTIKIRCEIDNTSGKLKPEMFVKINTLPDEGDMVLTVSSKALLTEGDKRIVIVEEGTGKYSKREVMVSSEREGVVQILSGLKPGERVVTEGNILLQAELAKSKS
ncbi:MAG TPA: efflux RND transporter periplasmic adaptor subunit [Candidatus Hypogeohydataceae bacterium YC40]